MTVMTYYQESAAPTNMVTRQKAARVVTPSLPRAPGVAEKASSAQKRRARKFSTSSTCVQDAIASAAAAGSSHLNVPPFQHVVVHAPAEVLVEGRGAAEHPFHICDGGGVPTTDVLVKGEALRTHIASS